MWRFKESNTSKQKKHIIIESDFPCGSTGKESTCSVGDQGSIPGLGRSPGEGNGYPLQYSGLENSTDCIAHGIAMSWTQLNHFTFFHNGIIQDQWERENLTNNQSKTMLSTEKEMRIIADLSSEQCQQDDSVETILSIELNLKKNTPITPC